MVMMTGVVSDDSDYDKDGGNNDVDDGRDDDGGSNIKDTDIYDTRRFVQGLIVCQIPH